MKTICFHLLLLISCNSFSQLKFDPAFNVGVGLRGGSIELVHKPRPIIYDHGFYFDPIKLSQNINLAIDVKNAVHKDLLYLQLSTYLRYGYLRHEGNNRSREIKGFKADIFLDVLYYVQKHKPLQIMVGAGFGRMNMGTGFMVNRNVGVDPAGNPIFKQTKSSFSFIGPRIISGIEFRRFTTFIILHGTPDDNYTSNPTLWPELKLGYAF